MNQYMTACHGKTRYATRAEAKDHASRVRRKGGVNYSIYECPAYPGHWHLASPPGQSKHLRRSASGSVHVKDLRPPTETPDAFTALLAERKPTTGKPSGVCPTPWRVAHTTHAAADKKRINDYFRYDATLYVFECRCGAFHLSDNLDEEIPAGKEPSPADVERLRRLDLEAFQDAVDADVKRTAPLGERLALRHPDNLTRWRWSLKALLREVHKQLAEEIPGQERLDGWHMKARMYEDGLNARLAECQALRTHAQHHYTRAS